MSWWLNPLLKEGVVSSGDYCLVSIAPDNLVAFHITAECSAVVLVAPLLVVGAFFVLSQRIRWVRALAGIVSMLVVIVVANQLRLGLIAWATQMWGMSHGYEITHRLVGSLIGIVGFIAGLVTLILASGLRRSKEDEGNE